MWSKKGRIPGSAQAAKVTAILEELLFCKKKGIKMLVIVTDSDYCYKARKEELELWGQREFENTKGKPLTHAEQ